MNPEQLLNSIETVISKRPVSSSNRWVICWLNNKLQCLPSDSVKDDGNIFGNFSTDELINGFSIKQWSDLSRNIVIFLRSKSLCQKHQKPLL
jgi:hypothetical protein